MLNTEDFIKRLEFIMEHFSLSASSFADKINVQRSSISHLLSGRNKPSLDFILKILDVFPELNLYWFLDGTGSFLKNEMEDLSLNNMQISTTPTLKNVKGNLENSILEEKNSAVENQNDSDDIHLSSHKNLEKQIEKIVLFYTDGTFKDYNPTGLK